ncbi:MAG: hypothetical protein KF833_23290 [Verrucomicrobiae bacterium]|nr:hypothetical protein [Verrucomicrobiae bacterium]
MSAPRAGRLPARGLTPSFSGGEHGAEALLTEMSDEDLLKLVALDMKTPGTRGGVACGGGVGTEVATEGGQACFGIG